MSFTATAPVSALLLLFTTDSAVSKMVPKIFAIIFFAASAASVLLPQRAESAAIAPGKSAPTMTAEQLFTMLQRLKAAADAVANTPVTTHASKEAVPTYSKDTGIAPVIISSRTVTPGKKGATSQPATASYGYPRSIGPVFVSSASRTVTPGKKGSSISNTTRIIVPSSRSVSAPGKKGSSGSTSGGIGPVIVSNSRSRTATQGKEGSSSTTGSSNGGIGPIIVMPPGKKGSTGSTIESIGPVFTPGSKEFSSRFRSSNGISNGKGSTLPTTPTKEAPIIQPGSKGNSNSSSGASAQLGKTEILGFLGASYSVTTPLYLKAFLYINKNK